MLEALLIGYVAAMLFLISVALARVLKLRQVRIKKTNVVEFRSKLKR